MNIKPPFKLGILGGGQLARMLALATHPYGIETHIYAESALEPAPAITAHWTEGSLSDLKAIEDFLKKCDAVTFESEFLDAIALAHLSKKTKTPIHPSPQLMAQLQDRLTQKKLLVDYDIPTAPFRALLQWEDLLSISHKSPLVVVKQRRFGYDGNGTFFIDTRTGAKEWERLKAQSKLDFIGEQKITFRRELALLLARDQTGTIVDFPLVESKQTNARCDWVMGPTAHPREHRLRKKLKALLQKENYVGLIAFELFDTGEDLLVNEVAPRVHNSGHYSLDALTLNQFQAHVQAVSGLELSPPKILSPFAMANLLGQSNASPSWPSSLLKPRTLRSNIALQLHWYGKQINRPHRKMGHINALGPNPKAALKAALEARGKVHL